MYQYFLAHIKRFCHLIYLSVNKLTNYEGCQNLLFVCILTVIIKHVENFGLCHGCQGKHEKYHSSATFNVHT